MALFWLLLFFVGLSWLVFPRELCENSVKWSPLSRREASPRMILAYRIVGAVLVLIALIGNLVSLL